MENQVLPGKPYRMDQKEYLGLQTEIVGIGRMAFQLIKLERFIRDIEFAETVAPLIDPTLYLKGSQNMKAIKELAISLRAVREAYETLQRNIIQTMAEGNMGMEPES